MFTQRFLIEFLKEAQVEFEKGHLFNQGQLLSLPPLLVGLWLLWRAGKDPQNLYGYARRDLDEPSSAARVAGLGGVLGAAHLAPTVAWSPT